MTQKSSFSAADLVAIILSITLGLTLLVVVIMTLVFNRELSHAGSRLLTTIGVGLVGSLSVYIGRAIARNGHKSESQDEDQL